MKKRILLDNGKSKLWVIENYTKNIAQELRSLKLEKEPLVVIGGKKKRQRRNLRFFSNDSRGYRYSGQLAKASPMEPVLSRLMDRINTEFKTQFNGVLVNQYLTGEHCIGAHSDEERSLDKQRRLVVSLAYGTMRTFRVRDKKSRQIVLDYPHRPCSLLVMEGNFQQDYTHEIPPDRKVKSERISLTFRCHSE